MKKLLSIAMATALAVTCTAGIAAGTAAAEVTPAPAAETAQVYLVPGSWYDAAAKTTKYNTVEGATALSADEKTALHLEAAPNVYKAGAAGTTLPTPATTHTDAEGEPFVFQGWWYIEDATVTYTETVPSVKEDLYLYADFRAALSQRHEPAAPTEQGGGGEKNFMLVTHEDDTTDVVPLLVSGTDAWAVDDMGYGTPVQFFNEYFTLRKNDRIKVYLTNVDPENGDAEPVAYPKLLVGPSYKYFPNALEASGSNRTSNYLFADSHGLDGSGVVEDGEEFEMAYIPQETMTFRIYIKVNFASSSTKSGQLSVYIERKA